MPDNVTNELLHEAVKSMQADLAHIKGDVRDVKEGQINVREDLQAIRRDALRQERTIAAVQVNVEHINKRLGINDPKH